MAHTFSLQNTFGAGQRQQANLAGAAQNREFNSLRLTGERQRQDIQQREFDADQQRANTEKLLVGIGIIRNDPSMAPRVLGELAQSQILQPDAVNQGVQLQQTDPQAFEALLTNLESQLMFALGQAAPGREDRKILAGADKINRFVDTGEQVFEGVEAPTGIAAAGAAERFFGSLTANLSDEQKADARLIQLGLEARAGTTSSIERIAGDEELTEDVAESQATIAEARKFGEATGALRSKLIDKGVESIKSIDQNLRNLDKAIAAIDEGASTGAIVSRFTPTIRKATVKLEQIRSELGLDVVGGVTFGALSKGELDLALTVALPINLQPPELKQWLQDKQAAVRKLRSYYVKQIDFLDQGGTVAGFLRQQERQTTQTGTEAATQIGRFTVEQVQ